MHIGNFLLYTARLLIRLCLLLVIAHTHLSCARNTNAGRISDTNNNKQSTQEVRAATSLDLGYLHKRIALALARASLIISLVDIIYDTRVVRGARSMSTRSLVVSTFACSLSTIIVAICIAVRYTKTLIDIKWTLARPRSAEWTLAARNGAAPRRTTMLAFIYLCCVRVAHGSQASAQTTTDASKQPSATMTTPTTTAKPQLRCADENYCLNGGTCVVVEHTNQMRCLCPHGFYGTRCQTRDICQTLVADSLTGEQICGRIQRQCVTGDKFFRCKCKPNEYFVFQLQPSSGGGAGQRQGAASQGGHTDGQASGRGQTAEGETAPVAAAAARDGEQQSNAQPSSYVAECRKVDKCLGVRCRQLSEVCDDTTGQCVCNAPFGYSRDPGDNLCKLIDWCAMPRAPAQAPVCGEARCVATYDADLYKCVCPIGYTALQTTTHRSSTRCVLMNLDVCDTPLLNKCQHVCEIDRDLSKYRCSCLPGYRPGMRAGIDDHLCFFIERPAIAASVDADEPATSEYDARSTSYEFVLVTAPRATDSDVDDTSTAAPPRHRRVTRIKLVRRHSRNGADSAPPEDVVAAAVASNDDKTTPAKMSAQERCNMFCEENKICVLESGTTDSYRCVCDRQGYVSVADRCLDWCAAAEFSNRLRGELEKICYSGSCAPVEGRARPPWRLLPLIEVPEQETEVQRLERESSWRPTFECDCSHSPVLRQDAHTHLCVLDFDAILSPCLPGNAGYIDCVQHKNAFCAVLHRPTWLFMRSLHKDTPASVEPIKTPRGGGGSKTPHAQDEAAKPQAAYTCVCSPDKKLLVDKPRNKARCVDECDLLNIECGRFNRMCRPAAMPLSELPSNLVRLDSDGVRMNLKRTGCECLPGFNVGPAELIDFTLDDNYPASLGDGSEAAAAWQAMTGPAVAAAAAASPAALQHQQRHQQQLQQSASGAPHLGINPNYGGLSNDRTEAEQSRAKYMNINSRCLLDYDVVEFHAGFKAPADFDPNWVRISDEPPPVRVVSPKLTAKLSKRPSKKQPPSLSQSEDTTTEDTATSTVRPASSEHASLKAACTGECLLSAPDYMHDDIGDLHRRVVLVAQCDQKLLPLSFEAYNQCVRYRYWLMQKLRQHFVDWRRVMTAHLSQTFDLMDGNVRLRVNKCEAKINHISSARSAIDPQAGGGGGEQLLDRREANTQSNLVGASSSGEAESASQMAPVSSTQDVAQTLSHDPYDYTELVDADIHCDLTIHSSSADLHALRKVLLEKQLPKLIFEPPADPSSANALAHSEYYLMAPNMLIRREAFDQLAEHRKLFNPCKSEYEYCDKQTKCEMVDTVNYTCTCDYGYTPIGSRNIYKDDSRKEVCEDINECLFDVCKQSPDLANYSTCINEIGDYRCQCNRHYTGDNKRYCVHVCKTIPCKHGECKIVDDHHAFCRCDDGYKEIDCSVQDPNVALRKANMIICGSIFTSVLLLTISFAIRLSSQLKKTKKKLKRLEAASNAANMFELAHQQTPFRTRLSKVSGTS